MDLTTLLIILLFSLVSILFYCKIKTKAKQTKTDKSPEVKTKVETVIFEANEYLDGIAESLSKKKEENRLKSEISLANTLKEHRQKMQDLGISREDYMRVQKLMKNEIDVVDVLFPKNQNK